MSRSSYKVPYVHKSLIGHNISKREKFNTNIKITEKIKDKTVRIKTSLFFWKRNSMVTNALKNKKVAIYNGIYFLVSSIHKDAVGFKLGAFSYSRRKPPHKGKQKQTKKQTKKQIKKQIKKK